MLPQELVDMVIDHLYDDRPTLFNCSLVCRSWLRRSRVHKFATIDYGYGAEAEAEGFIRLKPFAECPEAADFVRSIITYDMIPSDIALCVNLTLLEVHGVTFSHDTAPLAFPHLKSLIIKQCGFQNPERFPRLLQSFPRLSSLEMCACYIGHVPEMEDGRIFPPFTGDLVVGRYFEEVEFPALLNTILSFPGGIHFSAIRLFTCTIFPPFKSIFALNALLKACGPSLERLDLDGLLISEFNLVQQLDLSYNTSLRELYLPSSFSQTAPLQSGQFRPEWQSGVLGTISLSALHTLGICSTSWDHEIVVDRLGSDYAVHTVITGGYDDTRRFYRLKSNKN